MESLRLLLENREKEIENWKAKFGELVQVADQLKLSEARLLESENKIVLLTGEIERLNALLQAKQDEIDEWRSKYAKLEITISELRTVESRVVEYENRIAMLA